MFSTPVSCSNGCHDGSIKAGAEILISRTEPAEPAFAKAKESASTSSREKSKMALLPVRCAIWVTDGVISSGRQTKAMIGFRCSSKMAIPPLQRDTLAFSHHNDFL